MTEHELQKFRVSRYLGALLPNTDKSPMSNQRMIPVGLVVLAAALLAAAWWIGIPTWQRQHSSGSSKLPPSSVVDSDTQKRAHKIESNAQFGKHQIGDLAFSRVRVSLPQPVQRAWRGAVFSSENAFEKDRRWAVVEVLPGWIRQALRYGNRDAAAGYLWTLKKLAGDDDPAISSEATLAIYRLGDIDGFARAKISDWIAKGWDFKSLDTSFGKSEYLDIRARVLREFAIFKDRSFDDVIVETWRQTRPEEGKSLGSVDYGYYLEKHGRELPADYWMQRLDDPSGFANALEIAEKKGTPEVTAKLEGIFKQLHAMPAASRDAGRAASVASALFRQTGEAEYRDYLVEQAQTQLGSGSFESSLPKLLDGLAATKEKGALEIVSTAMQHENAVIREMAIEALGKTRDPSAAELLFEAAIQKAKEGKGFPAREMRALLAQDDPGADSKYERLQQALLNGQLGWWATTSDFEALEFFRKHGRR